MPDTDEWFGVPRVEFGIIVLCLFRYMVTFSKFRLTTGYDVIQRRHIIKVLKVFSSIYFIEDTRGVF